MNYWLHCLWHWVYIWHAAILMLQRRPVPCPEACLLHYSLSLCTARALWCACRYVLAYIESFRGVRAGERVWQLGFGSGFKVNSAVWVANKRNKVSNRLSVGLGVHTHTLLHR